MKRKYTIYGMIMVVVLAFSSCQLGKHYARPELNLPQQLDSTEQDTLSIADRQWWELYTDTTLQALIERTLEYNKDMKIAAARVKELAAMKRIDFANLFPQVSGKLYADKEAENYGGDNYSSDRSYEAKAIVSWEVDLWGNLRWAKDKSMADFLGSIEAQRALKMSLVAEVAQAYFELVALDNEITGKPSCWASFHIIGASSGRTSGGTEVDCSQCISGACIYQYVSSFGFDSALWFGEC